MLLQGLKKESAKNGIHEVKELVAIGVPLHGIMEVRMIKTDKDAHRVNLSIPAVLYQRLATEADLCGKTIPDLLRESLRLRLLVSEAQRSGAEFYLEHGDQRDRIVMP